MSITDIIVLLGFIFAFLAFIGVLAWGDYQTTKEIARLRVAGRAPLNQSKMNSRAR